ncbi:hypothetical protein GDO81_008334 [Engystomops pustulosus]|uniref:Uncharacterized protein n=1 Tax=Engystomops pustulosus TaxID=76066 RepID=A0AAV7CDX1_ENGPU|nr:hypothetical protein GDO81_008334 [Engystomops pustulosus]
MSRHNNSSADNSKDGSNLLTADSCGFLVLTPGGYLPLGFSLPSVVFHLHCVGLSVFCHFWGCQLCTWHYMGVICGCAIGNLHPVVCIVTKHFTGNVYGLGLSPDPGRLHCMHKRNTNTV